MNEEVHARVTDLLNPLFAIANKAHPKILDRAR
jgi:hypothetical protein